MQTSIQATIGKNLIFFDEIESTNEYANHLLAKTSPINGTCILTDFQTAGKGQIGRSWESAAGENLLLSYIFFPIRAVVADQFAINMAVALSIKHCISDYCDQVSIKWPNDIYVHNRKICGILIQNSISGQNIKNTILGIGINVNQMTFADWVPNPTSLRLETGHTFDKMSVFVNLNKYLGPYLQWIDDGRHTEIIQQYNEHLYKKHLLSTFIMRDGSRMQGQVDHVDHSGRLNVVDEQGIMRSYAFGDLKMEIGPLSIQ
jgi:BirA family transcriptional regulator, biotin operon repressor / biotin---[acetyl-CoA-carboxylase] ligase